MVRKIFSRKEVRIILQEMSDGLTLEEAMKKFEVSKATLYRWKKQAQKRGEDEINRLKMVEQENTRLKHLLAEAALEIQALKERLKSYL